MEFTKDIYFEDSPTARKKIKIIYSGTLFQNGSNNVNIVYGFGEAWNNTTTKPMEKTDNGFVVSVRMKEFDTFNFCFSDENNNWDNNNYFNYVSPILPDIQENTSIDDIIEDILGNTTKQDIVNDKDNNSIDKILDYINEEPLPEIETLFNELFNTSNEDVTNEPVNIENNETLEKVELYENSVENEEAKLNIASFNLDGLISDLLEPVILNEASNQNIIDENYSFQDIKTNQDNDETSLAIINSEKFLVSPRKLSYFYKLRKRIRLAFMKLTKLSKNLVKQLGL